jgi:crossover junction endodeoxyribonuclease RuvC
VTHAVRILGIDPGLRKTGWGIVTIEGTRLSFVACGAVTSTVTGSLAERLRELYEGLTRVVADFAPDEAAVEETFVNKDAKATLKLGHARGIALLVPALAGLPVFEYPANSIKKSVVGAGHADKKQVQAMVKVLLPKSQALTEDAADALAVAIAHAHHRPSHTLAASLKT